MRAILFHVEGKFLYNKPLVPRVLIERARKMRKKSTSAEDFMWQLLRNRQFNGLKFRRQHSTKEFILDFYCHKARLGIELDGGIHNTEEVKRNDKIRTYILADERIRIIRFTNDEVFEQTEKVLNKILDETNIEELEPEEITKEDIFHYVYGVLHNPAYRKKYEMNLKREFPRIPFYDDFRQWAEWGKKLMDLHIDFETVVLFPLERIDSSWEKDRTPKAKLTADKQYGIITLNEQTSLKGIPKEPGNTNSATVLPSNGF